MQIILSARLIRREQVVYKRQPTFRIITMLYRQPCRRANLSLPKILETLPKTGVLLLPRRTATYIRRMEAGCTPWKAWQDGILRKGRRLALADFILTVITIQKPVYPITISDVVFRLPTPL